MRIPLKPVSLTVIVILLALWALGAARAQVKDPIPERIVKRGLTVQIKQIARLPDTRGRRPADQDMPGWARVSFVRDLPDGRRFAQLPASADGRPARRGRGGNPQSVE